MDKEKHIEHGYGLGQILGEFIFTYMGVAILILLFGIPIWLYLLTI